MSFDYIIFTRVWGDRTTGWDQPQAEWISLYKHKTKPPAKRQHNIPIYFNTIINNKSTHIKIAIVIQLQFPLLFLATFPKRFLARSSVF